jgi:DNA repair protein RecN (Recombination protein N)
VQTCQRGDEALYSGEDAASSRLARVASQLRELARIDPQLVETGSLLESAQAQIDEASLQLRRYAERVDSDPEHLARIDDRLALIRRLARKHDCSADDLAQKLQMLRDESERLTGSLDVESAREAVVKAGIATWRAARALSTARRKAASELQRRVSTELPNLGLQAATFTVEFASEPTRDPSAVNGALSCEDPFRVGDTHLSERGCDRLEFLLGANPGEQARPLAKIASGGELSRIMLSLKVITAGRGEVDTLVFDEVDAGIGGVVAEAVGRRLRDLARARQILCITHLPQIAVHADHHFAVEKHVRKGRTVTGAKPLSGDERVTELSRMLGGAVDSREAERYIRRLVRAAQKEPAI